MYTYHDVIISYRLSAFRNQRPACKIQDTALSVGDSANSTFNISFNTISWRLHLCFLAPFENRQHVSEAKFIITRTEKSCLVNNDNPVIA